MEYRVEKKFLVSNEQILLLSTKLKTVMKLDSNQQGSAYTIRSLYFDDIYDNCMQENESGIDERHKLRMRIYEPSAQKLYLENKEKYRGYTKKTRNVITRDECAKIMQGVHLNFDSKRVVVNKLSLAMKTDYMRPKAIIEYDRTAFIHPLGNVRITFDQNISASKSCEDFLSYDINEKIPVLPKGMHILEVKYDEFLPDYIAQLIEDGQLIQTAFSKYYLGRLATEGEFVY